MAEEMKVEKRDIEYIASCYLCEDLPKNWEQDLIGEDDDKRYAFYEWVEQNAWEPFEQWEGEELWDHIENTVFDMIRYMKHRK